MKTFFLLFFKKTRWIIISAVIKRLFKGRSVWSLLKFFFKHGRKASSGISSSRNNLKNKKMVINNAKESLRDQLTMISNGYKVDRPDDSSTEHTNFYIDLKGEDSNQDLEGFNIPSPITKGRRRARKVQPRRVSRARRSYMKSRKPWE